MLSSTHCTFLGLPVPSGTLPSLPKRVPRPIVYPLLLITCLLCPAQDETSVSSEDFDMNDSAWMSADSHLASSLSPNQEERMRSPQNLHSQEDGECPLAAGRAGPHCPVSGLHVPWVVGPR